MRWGAGAGPGPCLADDKAGYQSSVLRRSSLAARRKWSPEGERATVPPETAAPPSRCAPDAGSAHTDRGENVQSGLAFLLDRTVDIVSCMRATEWAQVDALPTGYREEHGRAVG